MSQNIKDIQEIKSHLSSIGQTNVDENVIKELLESFGPNYELNQVIGIISGSLDSFESHGDHCIDKPGPSHTENSYPDLMDDECFKTPKTVVNPINECNRRADIIYVSSDEADESKDFDERHEGEFEEEEGEEGAEEEEEEEEEGEDDEDADDEEDIFYDYYLGNGTSEEGSDTEIGSKPTSPALINTLDIHDRLSPIESVSMEILEENNNDPNNNLDVTQIFQETDNNLSIHNENEQTVIKINPNSILMNTDIPGPSGNKKPIRACTPDRSKLSKEVLLIKSVLPQLNSSVIHTALSCNRNAKNRIELTLWDLLPKKRPIPQLINKRKSPNQISCIKPKKSCKIPSCTHSTNDVKDIDVDHEIVPSLTDRSKHEPNSDDVESMNSNIDLLEKPIQKIEVSYNDNNMSEQSHQEKIQTINEDSPNTNNSSVTVTSGSDEIQVTEFTPENHEINNEESAMDQIETKQDEKVEEINDTIIPSNDRETFASLNEDEDSKDVEMQDVSTSHGKIGRKVLIKFTHPAPSFGTKQSSHEISNNHPKIIQILSVEPSLPNQNTKVDDPKKGTKTSTVSRIIESVATNTNQNIKDSIVSSNTENKNDVYVKLDPTIASVEQNNPLIRPPKLILSAKFTNSEPKKFKIKSIVAPARFIVNDATNANSEPRPGPFNQEATLPNNVNLNACILDTKSITKNSSIKVEALTEEQIIDRYILNWQKKNEKLEKFEKTIKIAKSKNSFSVDPKFAQTAANKIEDNSVCVKKKTEPSLNQNRVAHTDLNDAKSEIPKKIQTEPIVENYDLPMYYQLSPMFPNVDPAFIKSVCVVNDNSLNPTNQSESFNHTLDYLIYHGHKHPRINPPPEAKTEKMYDLHEQYDNLLGIFPNAEPGYLRKIAESIYDKPEEMKQFVQSKLERPDYPTREQYLARKKVTDQQKQYTTDFTVSKFLEIFPDPVTYFEKQKKKSVFNATALDFLKHHFNKFKVTTLLHVYQNNQYNLTPTVKELQILKPDMKSTRTYPFFLNTEDIPLLQEIAYITHKDEIMAYFEEQKRLEDEEFQQHKNANALLECECCYDNECVPMKCSTCDDGHVFCHACIVRGTEAKLSDGQSHIQCFVNCESEFSLAVLQKVLKPTQFSILLKKRQENEIMTAGLEGLVSCPFCHFASIPPPENKVFECLNPECMKESCKFCRKPNHVPLTCDEVDAEKIRHVLEEKMTEALIRNCYKCNMPFFKEEGCNKMTCVCGALMCYLCDKPVKNYDHFNSQGSSNNHLCPLYSDDRHINAISVRKIAEVTEKQIRLKNPNIKLDTKSLLPPLPSQSRGSHNSVSNANVLPPRIQRIAGTIPQ